MKLNLGAGAHEIDGYENLDSLKGQKAFPLEYTDGTIDEIRASHILEHFSWRKTLEVLKNWTQKLKPGGILKIAVPDLEKVIERYYKGKKEQDAGLLSQVQPMLMGGQDSDDDYHKCALDRGTLEYGLHAAGLINIQEWKSDYKDCSSYPESLNLQGQKPVNKVTDNKEYVQKEQNNKPLQYKNIQAVFSAPRLAFTDNLFCAMRAFTQLGIGIYKGCGVFWGQVLERLIEQRIEDGAQYIFTFDYDTWFLKEHVIKLCQLMVEHPEADALIPWQVKRENDVPLMGMKTPDGKKEMEVPIERFQQPLTQVITGHFGLTIFKASAFKKMKKPWLWAQPAKDGSWNEGRLDDDIYFWHNFNDSENKLFVANEVKVGHLQLACWFNDELKKGAKPFPMYLCEVEKGNIPKGCVPKIEFKK